VTTSVNSIKAQHTAAKVASTAMDEATTTNVRAIIDVIESAYRDARRKMQDAPSLPPAEEEAAILNEGMRKQIAEKYGAGRSEGTS
jgi:hypothetical protein